MRLVKTNLKRFKSKDEPSVHLLVSFTCGDMQTTNRDVKEAEMGHYEGSMGHLVADGKCGGRGKINGKKR